MITQHPVDNQTLLRAIELLDRYMFTLQDDKQKEAEQHLQYVGIVLHNLRNALKVKARFDIEDDQAYHAGKPR